MGIKPQALEKVRNGNLPPALQIFKLVLASGVWRSSTSVPKRIWLDEEGSLKSHLRAIDRTHTPIQTSKEVQGLAGRGKSFSLALGDVMPILQGQEMP